MNEATVKITGVKREELIGSDFWLLYTTKYGTRSLWGSFSNGFVIDSPLTLCHKDGKLTDVLFNGSVINDRKVLGIV
jgi:PAS domain-containing protein